VRERQATIPSPRPRKHRSLIRRAHFLRLAFLGESDREEIRAGASNRFDRSQSAEFFDRVNLSRNRAGALDIPAFPYRFSFLVVACRILNFRELGLSTFRKICLQSKTCWAEGRAERTRATVNVDGVAVGTSRDARRRRTV
jgi:hypothetical protein